jgi:hypothetical protein
LGARAKLALDLRGFHLQSPHPATVPSVRFLPLGIQEEE